MGPYDRVPITGAPGYVKAPDVTPRQMNHYYERAMAMPYGRPLRGLGTIPSSPFYSDSWAGGDGAVQQANLDDDAVGNGIFDGNGSAPIQHASAGIFETRYAEPGFLYREPLTQDTGVVDARNGGSVLFRPAGGGYSEDMNPSYRYWDREVPRNYGVPTVPAILDSPVSGLGALESSNAASYAQWAVGGLIIGVAGAIMYGTLTMKGK
jgi:hypothetical protein